MGARAVRGPLWRGWVAPLPAARAAVAHRFRRRSALCTLHTALCSASRLGYLAWRRQFEGLTTPVACRHCCRCLNSAPLPPSTAASLTPAARLPPCVAALQAGGAGRMRLCTSRRCWGWPTPGSTTGQAYVGMRARYRCCTLCPAIVAVPSLLLIITHAAERTVGCGQPEFAAAVACCDAPGVPLHSRPLLLTRQLPKTLPQHCPPTPSAPACPAAPCRPRLPCRSLPCLLQLPPWQW